MADDREGVMLFLGRFVNDRTRDDEFWAVLWQGRPPPPDFKLLFAYNLLTDERIFAFEATETATIRWLDRLNMVGHFECQPVLDQTPGYDALFGRDFEAFEAFMRGRGAAAPAVERAVSFRRAMHEQRSPAAAAAAARKWRDGDTQGGGS